MKKRWKSLSVIGVLILAIGFVGSIADAAWREDVTITKLRVKEVVELNSAAGLTITEPTVATPSISNPTISGTVTGTGVISGTNVADVTRDIIFPLGAAMVDSDGDIDDGSAPSLTTTDSIPAIVWDNSGETVGVQWTFRRPSDFVSDFIVYCLISTDVTTATEASVALDWMIWVNADDTGFDVAELGQSTVTGTSVTLDASCEQLTLTLDATGEAAMVSGAWITLEIFNATTHNYANLELKGVIGSYTATQ